MCCYLLAPVVSVGTCPLEVKRRPARLSPFLRGGSLSRGRPLRNAVPVSRLNEAPSCADTDMSPETNTPPFRVRVCAHTPRRSQPPPRGSNPRRGHRARGEAEASAQLRAGTRGGPSFRAAVLSHAWRNPRLAVRALPRLLHHHFQSCSRQRQQTCPAGIPRVACARERLIERIQPEPKPFRQLLPATAGVQQKRSLLQQLPCPPA